MANYENNTDYQALINQAVAAGNYGQAAIYEQQRNAKISDMNTAGTNTNNYQLTNNYSGYLNGGSGGSITPAQQMAQQLSPATANQRQTVLSNMAGSMASRSTPAYQAPDTSAYDAQLAQALATLQDRRYQAPVWEEYYTERPVQDYVDEAIRLLQPQYAGQYEAARTRAAQNLDRAGLYNSLYGQALAAQQENAVTQALMSDASANAAKQRQQDWDNAMARYQAAMNNSQFEYSQEGERLKTVINSLHDSVSEVLNRSKMVNDYNLEAAAQDIQRQVAAADMLYQSAQIDSMEYENMLRQAQARTEAVDAQLKQAQLNEAAGIQTGGYYKAGADGKAPKGLSVGDYVVTNGGTYQITGVAADGSYTSKRVSDSTKMPTAPAAVDTGYSGGYSSGGYSSGGGRSSSNSSNSSSSNSSNSSSGSTSTSGRGSSYAVTRQQVTTALANGNRTAAIAALSNNLNNLTDYQATQLKNMIYG